MNRQAPLAAALVLVAMLQSAGGARPSRAAGDARPAVATEAPVTATDLVRRTANNSPLLAVDPTEPRFVALAHRQDGPDFACALQLSGDGGRTWSGARSLPPLPAGADKCYAPEVGFDRGGRLYYVFAGLRDPTNSPVGIFLITSGDRGRSFSRPRKVLGGERYQLRMAIDRDHGEMGRIHLVWVEALAGPAPAGFAADDNPIMAAHSDDGGRTFSEPVRVSDPDRPRALAPAVALGRGGKVHVIYYDLKDDVRDYQGLEGPIWEGTWSLVLATSGDAGEAFSSSRVVERDVVPTQRVMLAFTMPPPSLEADGDGQVYAAWHDARNGDWDVFLRRSSDDGRSWKGRQRLNDDRVGNPRHQYLPRLAVAPSGRLDVIFYDRRNADDNLANEVYSTSSSDGAVTFTPNVKLTTRASDSRIGPRYANASAAGLYEFGGRIALASNSSGFLAAWTDTRNTDLGPPAQDVYATTVAMDREDVRGGNRGTGGAMALVSGVTVVGALVALGIGSGRRRRRRRLSSAHQTPQRGVGA